jgi:hypothetical protein
MQVTKSQAASILGISSAEVLRRLEDGRLKGRKKTTSPFSDWLITIPDGAVGTPAGNAKIAEAVNAALEQSPMPVVQEIKKEEKVPEPEKEQQEEPTEEEIEKIEEESNDEEEPAGEERPKSGRGFKEFLNDPWWW